MMKTIQQLDSFKTNKKDLFSLVFTSPLPWQQQTPLPKCQNRASVIGLDSCEKRAFKHKQLKNNGELSLGTLKLCSATVS